TSMGFLCPTSWDFISMRFSPCPVAGLTWSLEYGVKRVMSHNLSNSVQRNNFRHPIAKAVAQIMGTEISDLSLGSIFCHQISQGLPSQRLLCFFRGKKILIFRWQSFQMVV